MAESTPATTPAAATFAPDAHLLPTANDAAATTPATASAAVDPVGTVSAASAARFTRITCDKPGEASLRVVHDASLPAPARDQVQVRVLAAGVAYTDLLIIRAIYYKSFPFPLTPGYDWVGTITATGPGVTSHAVGDLVAGMTAIGGMTQMLNVAARELVRVPTSVDPADAVCCILNYTTAYGLVHHASGGKVKPGASILVHGAAGGAGSAIVHIAKLAGVTRIFGTCSGPKMSRVGAMGVEPIDYKTEDFVARIHELTNGAGVDVVYDAIGGANIHRSYDCLGRTGRLVCYGFTATVTGEATGSPMWEAVKLFSSIGCYNTRFWSGRSATFFGVTMRKESSMGLFQADCEAVLKLLAAGSINPVIHARVALEDAIPALTCVGRLMHHGKLVLLADADLLARERAAGRVTSAADLEARPAAIHVPLA